MQRALSLAQRGAGSVSPNPMVGCVILSSRGEIIGEGFHERYGHEHAEVNALNRVQDPASLRGATLYVTLEPCSHHGKTPPCADLIADLRIERVVIAMQDPNPTVNGAGTSRLRDAGIQVDVGLLEKEAGELNRFYVHYMEFGRPWVTLKIAQTADGYIAAPNGDSRWISSEESRRQVHRWRSEYDAVMVGRQTAELDNPSLTVRLTEGRQPRRVVIDGPFSLSRELNLFSDQLEEKTIVVTWNRERAEAETDPMLKLMQSNFFRGTICIVGQRDGHTDLHQAMKAVGEEGVTSLLVEGGSRLGSALLREDLVDQLELFIAPMLLGGGTRSVLGLGIERMEEIRSFRSIEWTRSGKDMRLTGIR